MRRVTLMILQTAVLLHVPGSVRSQGHQGNASLLTAARDRERTVRTLDVRFERADIIARGAFSSQLNATPLMPKSLVPEKETRLQSTNRLVLDGDRVRLEDNHPAWLMPAGRLEERTGLSLFNGVTAKVFFPKGAGGKGDPLGSIQKDARLEFVLLPEVAPITYTFRGLRPALVPIPLDVFHGPGTTLIIGGLQCVEHVYKVGDNTFSYWVSPGEDYVVRRIRRSRGGHLMDQTDITYGQDPVAGRAPKFWVRNQYDQQGTLLITTRVDVLDYRLNLPISAEEFELTFPEGAIVGDNKVQKWYRVKADGTMRELNLITLEEAGAVVAQPGETWYMRHRWLVLCVLLAGVLFAAYATRGWMTRRRVAK